GISHSVDGEAELREQPRRLHEIGTDLSRSLLVAPVADPDDVVARRSFAGIEDGGVRRLVEGPDPPLSVPRAVDLGERGAVGEDPGVVWEVAGRDVRGGYRAVMGVVEEEHEIPPAPTNGPESTDETWVVELVDDHQIRAPGELVRLLQDALPLAEHPDLQVGEEPRELDDRPVAMVAEELLRGPVPPSFAADDLVRPGAESAGQPAQKVCVAVAPVAHEGVCEDDDLHHEVRVVTRLVVARRLATQAELGRSSERAGGKECSRGSRRMARSHDSPPPRRAPGVGLDVP